MKEFKKALTEKSNKSSNTIYAYIRAVKDFKKFILEATKDKFIPEEIIELDIKEYKGYLLTVKKQSPQTINQKLSALKLYFNHLVAEGKIKDNPSADIKKVKVQSKNSAPKVLEKNDLYRLRREFYKSNNTKDIMIFEILYNTGIRVSELCNLELDDIEMSERKGELTIRQGKGGKYRVVPLNSEVRKAIASYLDSRVFTNSKKLLIGERGPMSRSGVFRIVKKYADLAKVEVHPHTLRHQFCHDLLAAGESISTVAELAGHSDINITYRYTLATEKEKHEAVEKLNGAL